VDVSHHAAASGVAVGLRSVAANQRSFRMRDASGLTAHLSATALDHRWLSTRKRETRG